MRKRLLLSIMILTVYMGIIFWISSLPNEQLVPEKAYGFNVSQSIKHLAEFGILGFLACSVALQISDRFPSLIGSSVFSVAYGIIDELHQSCVPTRHCTVLDMWVNSFGCLLGIVAYLVAIKLWRLTR